MISSLVAPFDVGRMLLRTTRSLFGIRAIRRSEPAGKAALPADRAAHLHQRGRARPAAGGLRRREPERRQTAQEQDGDDRQRRGAGHLHGCPAQLPAGRRRAARDPAGLGRPRLGDAGRGRAQGLQQGLGHVRAAALPPGGPARAPAGDPRRHQGGQGGAQRAGGDDAAELGRARHAQFVCGRRPSLHRDETGGPAPSRGQPGHLERAGPGLPPLSRWEPDARDVPARSR